MSSRFPRCVLSLVLPSMMLVVCGQLASAQGTPRRLNVERAEACPVALVVARPGDEFVDVPVLTDHATTVLMPEDVARVDPSPTVGIEIAAFRDMIFALPEKNARAGLTVPIKAKMSSRTLNMRFRLVDDESEAWRLIILVNGAAMGLQKLERHGKTGAVRCLPTTIEEFTRTRGAEYALLGALAEDYTRIPIPDDAGRTVPRRGVQLHVEAWGITKGHRLLFFEVDNLSLDRYRFDHISVRDDDQSMQNRAYAVLLNGRAMNGAVTELEPGERVRGVAWIQRPEMLGQFVSLVMSDPDGRQPVVRERIPVWDLTPPPTPEELEQQRREREAKRVQVNVTGSFGALFVGEGSDDTEATSLMGLGARAVMGITPLWAFEAEIAGGSSGETSAIESAKLGRVILGGRIRRGETTVWHARMGLGLQALRTSLVIV